MQMGNKLTNIETTAPPTQSDAAPRAEPRAASAHFNAEDGRIHVELTNGCAFKFPPRLVQGLEAASLEQLSAVEVSSSGYGLHWKDVDIDLSVPGLMAGRFGTAVHMTRLAAEELARRAPE